MFTLYVFIFRNLKHRSNVWKSKEAENQSTFKKVNKLGLVYGKGKTSAKSVARKDKDENLTYDPNEEYVKIFLEPYIILD